jgi:hypothetical protein
MKFSFATSNNNRHTIELIEIECIVCYKFNFTCWPEYGILQFSMLRQELIKPISMGDCLGNQNSFCHAENYGNSLLYLECISCSIETLVAILVKFPFETW